MVTQCENKLYTHIYTSLSVLIHARKTCKIKRLISLRWGYGSKFGLEVRPCSVPVRPPSWVWVSQREGP